ncbi:MAG: amino acid transport protein [Candidatus Riflebacteria bacterium]|nr:amino acid transport protein [Candidatus Riflebacteria bacterium]
MNFDYNSLMASMFWGTIGTGFFIYGKKRPHMLSLIGGIALMGLSYVVESPLSLSVISMLIIGGIYYADKQGLG